MTAGPNLSRLIPDCRIHVQGKPLELSDEVALVRVEVDLDAEVFAQCSMLFVDPALALIDGDTFASGVSIKVATGFAARLLTVFEGEVVALEPRFQRDKPPALRVVCQEALHRLALSDMTRAFNDADDRQIATAIAQEHGLSADAPEGTREHVLQANVSDAAFLRRRAAQHGNQVRIEGSRLVIGPADGGDSEVTLQPGDGIRKLKVKIAGGQQVGAVSVHGWDAANKREIVERVEPEGDAGEGAREHGAGNVVSLAGNDPLPPDSATAESMARARMRRLAERFVTAEVEMTGDARLLPGRLFTLDKVDEALDGKYRVDHATHLFDRHGYRLSLRAARVKKKQPPPPQRQEAQARRAHFRLYNARWGREDLTHGDEVEMLVDAENLEGRTVVFTVEHKRGQGWERLDEVSGVVENNLASARVPVVHPAMARHAERPGDDHTLDDHGGTRDLRFHVRLAAPGTRRPPPPVPAGTLRNARWESSTLMHRDLATMVVDAVGLEGRPVYFAIEHKVDEDRWEHLREVSATVRGGRAQAQTRIEHPAVPAHRLRPGEDHALDALGGTRELRFTASLTPRDEAQQGGTQ